MLVLRFDGAFLLRFAERTFDGWLLNVPPRRRRGFGRRPLERHSTKQVAPQAIGVGVPGVTQPTHDPGADHIEADPTGGELLLHPPQATAKAADVLPSQEPVRGKNPVAEEAVALLAREDDALVPMDLEPKVLQEPFDLGTDLLKPPLVIGEDEEVIDVADVFQPQPVGDEVVERVEVDV